MLYPSLPPSFFLPRSLLQVHFPSLRSSDMDTRCGDAKVCIHFWEHTHLCAFNTLWEALPSHLICSVLPFIQKVDQKCDTLRERYVLCNTLKCLCEYNTLCEALKYPQWMIKYVRCTYHVLFTVLCFAFCCKAYICYPLLLIMENDYFQFTANSRVNSY